MKKVNILYWTFTGLFALAMFSSGIRNAIVDQPSLELLTTQLGYPAYIIPFLGVAKVLGSIAILIPGFSRIKEWAYAGLFFDLVGATYSGLMAMGPDPAMLGMLFFFALFALSYIYHRKREALRSAQPAASRATVA